MTDEAERSGLLAGLRETVDLLEIARAIWRQKYVCLGVVGICFLLAIVYLHVAEFLYTSILQVTAVEDQSRQMKGNLSNLASAAGIELPGGNGDRVDEFELFLQNIYSRDTANELARNQNLMRAMYPREWDAQDKQWHSPSGLLHGAASVVRAVIGLPSKQWAPPDGVRIQAFIQRNVQVSRDLKNPIVTVQMDYPNPDIAMWFLSELHRVDDNRLRSLALNRTTKYIGYLNGELSKVTNDDYRKALIDLLSDQEKRRMFASSPSIAYAAELFGAPTSSSLPTKPNAGSVLLLSIAIGVLFGAIAAILWDSSQRRATLTHD